MTSVNSKMDCVFERVFIRLCNRKKERNWKQTENGTKKKLSERNTYCNNKALARLLSRKPQKRAVCKNSGVALKFRFICTEINCSAITIKVSANEYCGGEWCGGVSVLHCVCFQVHGHTQFPLTVQWGYYVNRRAKNSHTNTPTQWNVS